MSFEDGSSSTQALDSGEIPDTPPRAIPEAAKQLGSILVESYAVNHNTRPDLIFRGNTLHAPGEQHAVSATTQS